ncbi:MAG: DUF4870 domain-containing protein [Clostridia bacterium]|nr:DUF4870 domain-containing protein [Clostridia bacterium]
MNAKAVKVQPHKSSLGNTDANLMALLVYLAPIILAWIPGIKYIAWAVPLIVFFIEKDSKFVKFHSMQAILLSAVGAVLGFILSVIIAGAIAVGYAGNYGYGALGALGIVSFLALVITIIIIVFEIIAMVRAYGYVAYRIPLIGNWAAKIAGWEDQNTDAGHGQRGAYYPSAAAAAPQQGTSDQATDAPDESAEPAPTAEPESSGK